MKNVFRILTFKEIEEIIKRNKIIILNKGIWLPRENIFIYIFFIIAPKSKPDKDFRNGKSSSNHI